MSTILLLSIVGIILCILVGAYRRCLLLRMQISGLRERNEKHEVLAKELHHRVKNHFQVISSMLSLQYRHLEEGNARAAIREGQTRLETMCHIHGMLCRQYDMQQQNIRKFLGELLDQLIGLHDCQVRVDARMSDVIMDVDTLVTLGLIMNELVGNAFKHALKQSSQPSLIVTFHEISSGYELSVKDNGPGFTKGLSTENCHSFGLWLVHSLCRQLGGTAHVHRDNTGVAFQVHIPKAAITKQQATVSSHFRKGGLHSLLSAAFPFFADVDRKCRQVKIGLIFKGLQVYVQRFTPLPKKPTCTDHFSFDSQVNAFAVDTRSPGSLGDMLERADPKPFK